MFVVLMYVPFSVTTGRRVCADASRPLRWGPPIERGRAVALCRYGCRRRGPPAPGPACRQRGGLLTAVPSAFVRPHPPALSVRRRAPFCWRRVRLFRPPCPTLFRAFVRGLSAGLSPPGSRRRVCRRVCRPRGAFGGPYVFARPSPPSPGAVSACLVSWRYRCGFSARTRPPYSCFRSVGFRRPREAVEDSDRRAKQVRTPPGIAIWVGALAPSGS